MLALMLVLLGILLRFLPHAPNATPVAAIALFGAVLLPTKRLALIVPLALMMISDLFLGLHDMVVFTWGSVVLISLVGWFLRKSNKLTTILAGSLVSSAIFFIVTNFGVWSMGWYPATAEGLGQCYAMALPFFRTFLAGTLAYASALFGAYALASHLAKKTKFATVLLTD